MKTKFRAWDKHSQKMFADDELIIWNGNVYANDSKKLTCNNLKGWSIDDEYLMQSTGLKDKNGKEVFEGDVLGTKDGLLNGVVEYRSDLGMWTNSLIRYNNFERLCSIAGDREIIGNIYENREPLEDKE
nr:MAG TPA: YopX protein [Caudoviricetes sp.]